MRRQDKKIAMKKANLLFEQRCGNLNKYKVMLNEAKQGSPEELVDLLALLPVDETAKYLAEEIYQDIIQYYNNDIKPVDKKYTYHPEDKCLQPYIVDIDFRLSNNMAGLGYAQEDYIQVKYLSKDAGDYSMGNKFGGAERLQKSLFNIIKHECSHFYLSQKGVENCMYNTHPDGMKKYYLDRQELVLHSREMFDDFVIGYPRWKTMSIEAITKRLISVVKNLPRHTNINAPFNGGTQKKYLNFILKNYIKPNLQEKPIVNKENESEEIFNLLASAIKSDSNSVSVDDVVNDFASGDNGWAMASENINGFNYIIDTNNGVYSLKVFNSNNRTSSETFESFDGLYNKLSGIVKNN
jgi:hypothetical protein